MSSTYRVGGTELEFSWSNISLGARTVEPKVIELGRLTQEIADSVVEHCHGIRSVEVSPDKNRFVLHCPKMTTAEHGEAALDAFLGEYSEWLEQNHGGKLRGRYY